MASREKKRPASFDEDLHDETDDGDIDDAEQDSESRIARRRRAVAILIVILMLATTTTFFLEFIFRP